MTSAEQLGTSATFCDFALENQLQKIGATDVVDFGAGAGKNGILVRKILGQSCKLVAVEGYGPAVHALREGGVYDEVEHSLLQEWVDKTPKRHNVALFGDVMEHITPREIHEVMRACMRKFDFIIIVVPLHDIFQDDSYGNQLEVHKAYITQGFFDRYKPTEKHIVEGNTYTIMNLLIVTKRAHKSLVKRVMWKGFHATMLMLQPIGLARPFVSMLKAVLGGRAGAIR